MDKIKLSY